MSRLSLPALSGLFAVTVALGITSACGGDYGLPLSPTPFPSASASSSRFSAGTEEASSSRGVTVLGVLPSSGPTSGGTAITITGDGFTDGAMVLLGGLPALNVVLASTTVLTAITPAAPAEGAVDVVVTNPDGESMVLASGYTYTSELPGAPTVGAVSPVSGPISGGTEIVISGTNFSQGATVTLGTWPATNVVVLGDTTITAITPPHEAGTVDVAVLSPDGQSATLPGAYTYVADQPSADLVVTITASGVTPRELQVPVGARVTFVNNDSRAHDIESDPHPIHTDCPAIDAVGFIRPGESKQTGVFDVERACGYHDHNQSTNQALRGSIVVVPVAGAGGGR